MLKNYIFKYDLKRKEILGYKISEKTLEEIKAIQPASCLANETHSGWIKFANNKYEYEDEKKIDPGKWVLQFPKGNPALNAVWKKLVEGVASGELWEVQVSAQNDSPYQLMYIYTKHKQDLKDITRVYDYLEKINAIQLHLEACHHRTGIHYRGDEAMSSNASPLYHPQDIINYKKERNAIDTANQKFYGKAASLGAIALIGIFATKFLTGTNAQEIHPPGFFKK